MSTLKKTFQNSWGEIGKLDTIVLQFRNYKFRCVLNQLVV